MLFDTDAGAGGSGVDVGDIQYSLRCRASASTHLTRTFGSAGNQKTWTYSVWIKRSRTGVTEDGIGLLNNDASAPYAWMTIGWSGFADQFVFYDYPTGIAFYSKCKFREPTAFLHLVFVHDSTQATAADRYKLYINNVRQEVEASTGYPSLNYDGAINKAGVHQIGKSPNAVHSDGNTARIAFVGGSALTPSSFGRFNTEINEWVSKSQSEVKAVVDAGGTNSFMLDFDNATSLTTLGYDKSSKGNNWTLNNFSLTAGTTYDHMLDVPGNSFATLNPLDRNTGSDATDGNLKWNQTGGAKRAIRASQSIPDLADVYFEIYMPGTSGNSSYGISTPAYNITSSVDLGNGTSEAWGLATPASGTSATKYNNTSAAVTLPSSVASGDIFMFAIQRSTGKWWVGQNGTWVGTPGVSGELHSNVPTTGNLVPTCVAYAFAPVFNFGQYPFASGATYDSASGGYFRYTPPTGFKALCQRNLPDPAILNPEKHFDVLTYVGNNSTKAVTGAQFQPGLVWPKDRTSALNHRLVDVLRGVTKVLESNTTAAERTIPDANDTFTSFDSGGFTLGAGQGMNANLDNYVAWLWNMGDSTVTNNDGSVSSQVRANVLAGQSIVTRSGNSTQGATAGHGLGKVPGLVITFMRTGGVENHAVWHQGLTSGTYYLNLNSTAAQTNDNTRFAATPTSAVLNLGANSQINATGYTYVDYVFAEIPGYSKIGSYVGNGSADGPFVYCGFKPKYVMCRDIAIGAQWCVYDATRDQSNVTDYEIFANSSTAEGRNGRNIDLLSNGFKLRCAGALDINNNGDTHIFYAVADVPAKYSLGR